MFQGKMYYAPVNRKQIHSSNAILLLAAASSFFAVYVSAEVCLDLFFKYVLYQHLLLQLQTAAHQSRPIHCNLSK